MFQGPRSKFSSLCVCGWGAGVHACGFLFSFSKVTENATITITLSIVFHIFSDAAIGSENSPSLN